MCVSNDIWMCIDGLEFKKMCVSKDIWMCLLSAAIGGIISFLVLKFWNSPQTEAKRRPKIPVEHDERQG